MLYRKVKEKIKNWLNDSGDALLITGARQVGKSFIIEQTLKEENLDYVAFNFIKQAKLLEIFKGAINNDADMFLMELEIASGRKLTSDTIIFFDEIQECKEIVTIIKFLVEKGKYKYLLSGSLLGVELKGLKSAPVGYLSIIEMYPMDLEEFYIANGMSESLLQKLKAGFENHEPISEFAHERLIDLFYRYLIVGGMPEAVQTYVNTNDINDVINVHKKIIKAYKLDFTKYEQEINRLKLIKTYELIPSELSAKNKRFIFNNLDKEFHFDRYEESFNWLIDAGVAIPTYNCTEFQIPLSASEKSNLFKLFLSDVGLLTTQYGSSTILSLLNHGQNVNCGAMFENFVAQELRAKDFKLYYFNNKKHGEVDFLVEYKNNLLPIEVKSGKDYQVHSALSYFMETQYFNNAIVFSTHNVSVKENIFYYPIYMAMFLDKETIIPKVSKIDLSNL